jgi:hypothetical protein
MERLDLLPPGAAPSASAYIAQLRIGPSQKAMRRTLERVAVLVAHVQTPEGVPLDPVDLDRVPWAELTPERLVWLRDQLTGSLSSRQQALNAAAGVLAHIGLLDDERSDATWVHRQKPAVRPPPFEPAGHVRNDAMRALRACGLTISAIVELRAEAWRIGSTELTVGEHVVKVPDDLSEYVDAWVRTRGPEPGPLFCKTTRRRVWVTKPMSNATATLAVAARRGQP